MNAERGLPLPSAFLFERYKMKLNKNVIHNGEFLEKGADCPKNFEKELMAAGHLEVSEEAVAEAPKKQAKEKGGK